MLAQRRAVPILSFLPPLKAAPVALRAVVRARDVAGFVEQYRQHIDGDRIFLFTRVPPPIGSRVRFQIHLATGDCVLRGRGKVVRAVGERPGQEGGVELRFVATDEPSIALMRSIAAQRRDGVPVAVIEDDKTIATGPPALFVTPSWRTSARGVVAAAAQRWRYAAVGGAGIALGLALARLLGAASH